jgi:hypothetical protein
MSSVSIKSYGLQDVLPHIRAAQTGGPERIELDGDLVAVTSVRLRTFAFKGTRCVSCGIDGLHFRKVRTHQSDPRPHLNLYAAGLSDLIEVLMTKDHIIPRARGGPDALGNMQTMCFRCNERKGDSMGPDITEPPSHMNMKNPSDPTPIPTTREPCSNYEPAGWYTHWREWHRGHGCERDDGQPPPPDEYWTKDRHR